MPYYFKINNHDYSMYVNKLQVTKKHNYKEATTAAGNKVVKYINSKRKITVGIIPLDADAMATLLTDINSFQVSISYRDPETNTLVENVQCIIPTHAPEYFTIRADKVTYKALTLQIEEL